MSQWAHYSEADPEFAQLLPKLAPFVITDIATRREQQANLFKATFAAGDFPTTGLVVSERSIPVEGGNILIRTYIPSEPDGTASQSYPVLVDIHGGGYVLGNLDSDDIKCRKACVTHRISIVNVDYRLAPEYPWPIGLHDSYEAVKWVASHAEEIHADISKGFIVDGTSAGANFACIITQRAREDPELKGKITGQILQIPTTIKGPYPEKLISQLLSREQNKNDIILSRATLKIFMDAYKDGPADHPEVSPLLATSFANLPPAYMQVAGADPLRDDGLLYAQFLEQSGVLTKLDVYPGVPHGFATYFPQLKISQKWRDDFDEGLRWLLNLTAKV